MGTWREGEEGDWTCTGGRGESVIDYVLVAEKGRKGIRRMEVAENVDHRPVVVWLKKRRERVDRGVERERYSWSREGEERLKESIERMRESEEGVEEEWEKMKEKIKVALGEMKEKYKRGRKKRWWDKECRGEGEEKG